jgi:hypothetical protein
VSASFSPNGTTTRWTWELIARSRLVKAAQARGDFQVLAERQRRALCVHLGADVSAGLKKLAIAVDQALQ